MDGFIILSAFVEEGNNRLRILLDLNRKNGLEINFKKQQFLKEHIEFLGHIIGGCKIYPAPLKTYAVLNFPEPKNMKKSAKLLKINCLFSKICAQVFNN